jgi:hypothetical protein
MLSVNWKTIPNGNIIEWDSSTQLACLLARFLILIDTIRFILIPKYFVVMDLSRPPKYLATLGEFFFPACHSEEASMSEHDFARLMIFLKNPLTNLPEMPE